jgi:tRNA nucleotidyltransferase (CCA-adding enzyme)
MADNPQERLLAVASLIADKARTSGGRAYIVGGWCRDRLLGHASSDIDMEWFGASHDQVAACLAGLDYQVIIPSQPGMVPFKVILGSEGFIDITLPMCPEATASGEEKLVLNPSLPIEKAALRRDFTCNAIYHDLLDQSWQDPFGGIADTQSGLLRLVPGLDGQSMNETIPLRACRLAAQLGFRLDNATELAIRQTVARGCLGQLDPVLKTKEMTKLLTGCEKPSMGIRLADELGVLQALFPEIAALKEVPQNPVHHPEGSAYEHTLLVVDAAAELACELDREDAVKLMLAALFHDVGKLTTTKVRQEPDGLKISSHGHEVESVAIARRYFQGLDFSHRTRMQVNKLVVNHMKPMELAKRSKDNQAVFDNLVRQLVRAVYPADFSVFLRLCRADQRGRANHDIEAREMALLGPIEDSIRRNGFLERPNHRLMSGKSLRDLGFQEDSFDFGTMITAVEAQRDKGAIRTTDDASRYLLIHFGMSRSGIPETLLDTPAKKTVFYKALRGEILEGKIKTYGEIQDWAASWGHEGESIIPAV